MGGGKVDGALLPLPLQAAWSASLALAVLALALAWRFAPQSPGHRLDARRLDRVALLCTLRLSVVSLAAAWAPVAGAALHNTAPATVPRWLAPEVRYR